MIDRNIRKSKPRVAAAASSPSNDSLTIDPLQILDRHWWRLAIGVVACWLIAGFYYVVASPEYSSTAELLLEPKDAAAATNSAGISSNSVTTLTEDSLASHLSMIQSNRILGEAIDQNGLGEMPSLLDDKKPSHRSVAECLQEKLRVTRGGTGAAKKANTLKLELRHGNAEDCQYLLEAIVKRYQAFVKEKFVDDKDNLSSTINRAQELNQQELSKASAEYRQFRQDAPLLWNGTVSTNTPRILYEQLQSELNTVMLNKTELQSRLVVVEQQLKEIEARETANPVSRRANDLERLALIDAKSADRVNIFIQVLAGDASTAEFQSIQPLRVAAAQTEAAGLLELRQRERKLMLEFGAEHPQVRVLREQIADMQKFIDEKNLQTSFTAEQSLVEPRTLVNAYVQLMRNDLRDLEGKEKQIIIQSAQAEKEARALINYEIEGEVLKDQVDDLRVLYEATIDKLRDINLAAGYGGIISESLETPQIGKLVSPKVSICLAVGTLLGLFCGGGASLVSELRNRSLRTAKEIETVANLPIISQIPKLLLAEDPEYLRRWKESKSDIAPIVCSVHDGTSKEAEVFRGLRTSLFFRASELGAKTLAITSANSGDGKSTLSSNLAVSIAQAGRKVLLIECDLRKPAVAKLFKRQYSKGLADVLSQKVKYEDVLQLSGIDNMDILSAGTIPDNPAELLASPAFKDLIASVEAIYDFVILDCPPVLAVADPCIIANVADAVVVLVRLNPQSRVELMRTVGMLNEVNAATLGMILNDSRLEDDVTGGSRYGYMVGYGYGSYKDKANSYYQKSSSNGTS